jgi:hypothetical protein
VKCSYWVRGLLLPSCNKCDPKKYDVAIPVITVHVPVPVPIVYNSPLIFYSGSRPNSSELIFRTGTKKICGNIPTTTSTGTYRYSYYLKHRKDQHPVSLYRYLPMRSGICSKMKATDAMASDTVH